MVNLVRQHAGLDLYSYPDAARAREAVEAVGVKTEPGVSWGQVVEAVFDEKVEDKLIQPTDVIDLPKEKFHHWPRHGPGAHSWPNGKQRDAPPVTAGPAKIQFLLTQTTR
jgi:hypothetical protein